MRRYLYEHSLGLVLFALFALILAGQSLVGYSVNNMDRADHGEPPMAYAEYLTDGHFIEAVFENWESEFLQMGAFVVLTIFLRQKGSAESKQLSGHEPVDRDPRPAARRRSVPWPVRRGGAWLVVYENSLSLALFVLFAFSFVMHAIGGAAAYSEEQLAHGGETVGVLQYLGTAQFWFESLQNWQSEFLAVGALIVLAVFLRQRGSPESKPVDAPHHETGSQ